MGARSRPGAYLSSFWLAFAAFFCFLFLLVSQSVRSTLLSYKILDLEKQISIQQQKNAELERAKSRWIVLENIEEVARKELGLVSPDPKQIVVLSIKH